MSLAPVLPAPPLSPAAARATAPGGSIILAAPPNSAPLLTDRPLVDGAPAAYLCRGAVCDLPVTDPTALTAALRT